MCRCELAASCTSRRICSEVFECAEKISTITLLRWMARVISPANERPGCTSRGAIQQRIAVFSSAAQTASATGFFSDECEIKTSCAIHCQVRTISTFFPSIRQETKAHADTLEKKSGKRKILHSRGIVKMTRPNEARVSRG